MGSPALNQPLCPFTQEIPTPDTSKNLLFTPLRECHSSNSKEPWKGSPNQPKNGESLFSQPLSHVRTVIKAPVNYQ